MPWIENADRKQAIALSVLRALPDWFGIPQYVDEYAEKAREMACYAHEKDGEAVGFVCLKQTSECAAEVHVMGILPGWHRRGIGRAMIAACEARCRERNLPLLHVKTLDNNVGDAPYLKTYAFYRAMGFLPMEVLPLWDEHNPCLILVKAL